MHLTTYLLVTVVVGLTEGTPILDLLGRANKSPAPDIVRGKYVCGDGDDDTGFSNKAIYTFTGNRLPAGLSASTYNVGGNRVFKESNVVVRNGFLELRVPGGQKAMPYTCGQIVTDVDNIVSASVRTTAILTENPGTINGMFFYGDDSQETDIEWVSDPTSGCNNGVRKLWFTNQDSNGDRKLTSNPVTPPANPTSSEHEYRIDWTPGLTVFFVDGKERWRTTSDAPNIPGPWMWNNWTNGNKGWSVGPPINDSVFKIRKIEMYYNTAKAK
jgi:hypothetical protein